MFYGFEVRELKVLLNQLRNGKPIFVETGMSDVINYLVHKADSIMNTAKTWVDSGFIFEGSEKAGEDLSIYRLYYRLSELKEVGVIELNACREVGRCDADKVSILKMKESRINILTDLPEVPSNER
jgi:hypothetical protein